MAMPTLGIYSAMQSKFILSSKHCLSFIENAFKIRKAKNENPDFKGEIINTSSKGDLKTLHVNIVSIKSIKIILRAIITNLLEAIFIKFYLI